MLDFIGTKRLVIRRSDDGLALRTTSGERQLLLNREEWLDLVALIMAAKAATDFFEEYTS